MLLNIFRMAKCEGLIPSSVGEDTEKLKHFYPASGNIQWYNHFGKEFGTFYKKLDTYHMVQPFNSYLPSKKQNYLSLSRFV